MVLLFLGRTAVFWAGVLAVALLVIGAAGMYQGKKKCRWPARIAKLGGVAGIVHFALLLASLVGIPVV